MEKLTPQFLKKRKFMAIIPLPVLPFLTLIFWALGGGKGAAAAASKVPQHPGFNFNLPSPHIKSDSTMDKLAYYQRAEGDSERLHEAMRLDPVFKSRFSPPRDTSSGGASRLFGAQGPSLPGYDPAPPIGSGKYTDPNEEKVYSKIAQLNKILSQPVPQPKSLGSDPALPGSPYSGSQEAPGMEKVSKLLEALQKKDSTSQDPELGQLNSMLDKVLQIQHPDRVRSGADSSRRTNRSPFNVEKSKGQAPVAVFASKLTGAVDEDSGDDTPPVSPRNNFYEIDDDEPRDSLQENAITAVVHQTQTLVSGATVTLRLTSEIKVNKVTIPKDNLVYGTASLNGDRLIINITSIQYLKSIFPVALSVYDLDGLAGINVRGSINRDVSKQSLDQGVSTIDPTIVDPSLGAQAASAGIQAAKSLLSRKIRLVRVTIPSGYNVLLKPTHNQ